MNQINSIVHVAVLIVGSIGVVIGVGIALYFYYTASGQEEGE